MQRQGSATRTSGSRRGRDVGPRQTRRQMMATKSQADSQAPTGSEFFTQMQTKALDAFAAFAETNQRVLQGFVDLSIATAKEGMRAYAELQSAAVDAARQAQGNGAPVLPTPEELRSDPFTWYQKGLLTTVDGTQKAFRLLEANG